MVSHTPSRPVAHDFGHHLSRVTTDRRANFLKGMYKYAAIPGMTRMAEGSPSSAFLPYETLSGTFVSPDDLPLRHERRPSTLDTPITTTPKLRSFEIPRHAPKQRLDITRGLAYQDSQGHRKLTELIRPIVERLTPPAYSDWELLVHVGATDACAKVAEMFLERGDAMLVEEWTYPGSTASFIPLGVKLIGVKMDGAGLLPDHLRNVLAMWDPEEHGGAKRPRLLYTIPTGQNPTGATMDSKRKRDIYDICVEYDIIICEDDPYYHLYMGSWDPSPLGVYDSQTEASLEMEEGLEANQAFVSSLPPSFLEFDSQGRVIRIDTLSKTLAPGTRLGWFTASPLFIERLVRISEATTGFPSGFSSMITSALLQDWGLEGYVRWLRGLRASYKIRRDWLCDLLNDKFHLEQMGHTIMEGSGGLEVPGCMVAFDRDPTGKKSGPPIIFFIPPVGGLFVFMCIHFNTHPELDNLVTQHGFEVATARLQESFWKLLADNLVLLCPASAFDAKGEHAIGGVGNGFFRLSFAPPNYSELCHAIDTLQRCRQQFWVRGSVRL